MKIELNLTDKEISVITAIGEDLDISVNQVRKMADEYRINL